MPVAGYAPEVLDRLLQQHLERVGRELQTIETLGTRVHAAVAALQDGQVVLGDGTPGGAVELLTNWYERMARAGRQVVQGLDELTRLRSFLAGGPDSRPDLGQRGEHELMQFLTNAVDKLGLKLVPTLDVTPPPRSAA